MLLKCPLLEQLSYAEREVKRVIADGEKEHRVSYVIKEA